MSCGLAFRWPSSSNSLAVDTASQMTASREARGPFTAARVALALCGFTAVVGQIVLMRERLVHIPIRFGKSLRGLNRGLNGKWRNCFQNPRRHSTTDARTSDADAKTAANVHPVADTLVVVNISRLTSIKYPHHAAASATAQQACE